jgi:hypothetical protein
MSTIIKQQEEIKKKILDFTVRGVESFLTENPDLEFYAFAFDCNAEYTEINLCFNTEEDFDETLKYYQKGKYAQYYQTERDIEELKYNTGDWEYQCFETMFVFTEKELNEIFREFPDDNYESWNEFVRHFLEVCTECIIEFVTTETYKKIPKTKDFIAFCIDHDESIEEAMERLERIRLQTKES